MYFQIIIIFGHEIINFIYKIISIYRTNFIFKIISIYSTNFIYNIILAMGNRSQLSFVPLHIFHIILTTKNISTECQIDFSRYFSQANIPGAVPELLKQTCVVVGPMLPSSGGLWNLIKAKPYCVV